MAVKIFICYAHKDEAFLNKLKTHLQPLLRQGLIDIWYERDISAGTDWEQEINDHLEGAPDHSTSRQSSFMASGYSSSVEMKRVLERYKRVEARVIPIILRAVEWKSSPFGKIQALPTDAKPVTSRSNEIELSST